MKSSKAVGDKITEGWSLPDQVEEQRGKYYLKKKDGEVYRASAETSIRENDHVIGSLRQDDRKKRVIIADNESGDRRVITTVFCNQKEESLALQRYTAERAIGEMDRKVCAAAKVLNAVHYETEKREHLLQELQNEVERLTNLEQPSTEQVNGEQRMRQLENALDKALTKYDSARSIFTTYQDILQRLKEESMTLPARLDSMEQALLEQSHEYHQLKDIAKNALEARDQAKKELSQVERDTFDQRRQRDAQLTKMRKDVERRKAEVEKVEATKKHARITLYQEQADNKTTVGMQQRRENQRKIKAHEDAIQSLMDATKVTNIEDIEWRILRQGETHTQLKKSITDLEARRGALKKELKKLEQEFRETKYSGESKLSAGQRMLEQMSEHIQKEQVRHEKIREVLERNGQAFVNVKSGVATLLEKLDEVKLKPPLHSYTRGDVFDQLELTQLKLEQLMKDIAGVDADPEAILAQLQTQEFHDFLESQLSPDNIRIRTKASETQLSEFDYDAQENVVLTGKDIKRIGQKLIDSKEKPKKQKAKKK